MSEDIVLMLRKVSLYNILIGVPLIVIVYLLFSKFTIPVAVGLVVGIINFILSSIITNILFTKLHGNSILKYILSFILRITLIALIGFIVFSQDKYNVFAYMGGYMIHLLGISIYSMGLKNVS